MQNLDINRIIYSVIVIVVFQLFGFILKKLAKRTQQKLGMKTSRYFAMRRTISIICLVLCIAAVFVIWQIDVRRAWVSITGILTLVALAFFAVWSLVGNILAGILIYFTSPFKIDDTIEVMPDSIRGNVLAINTFYTVLKDTENNYINVPNSLFFQKYIKVIRHA